MGDDTKICTTCGRDLPLSEYYTDRRNLDNLYSECKACVRSRRKAGRDLARQAEARYRETHRETLRERGRRFYQEHRRERIEAATRSRRKRREREQGQDQDST
jgi:hypothetical protein